MNASPSAAHLSGQPLLSLPLVALDTETTGLDVRKARILEIGAVKIVDGEIRDDDTFAQLLNPQEPIPGTATAIHGITDADVASAPDFATAVRAFGDWSGECVIVGCSIGFDLALLKAEHARAELPWQAPRSVDVLHLIQGLAPDLPDYSLATAAAWLNVEPGQPHRALGDALTAARLLTALAPRLRAAGVVTLAQVERAARRLISRIEQERRVGWVTHDETRPLRAADMKPDSGIDSYPYRHKIREVMSAPPKMTADSTSLGDALDIMMNERVSSVFLPADGTSTESGILTERDVLRALQSAGADALSRPVSAFASRGLQTIAEDDFVYRAVTKMATLAVRHLGVVDGNGELTGALSARDLLKQRAAEIVTLGESIRGAQNAEALGRIWSELSSVTRQLVYEQLDARDIAAIISNELRALTAKACELAARSMLDGGYGPAPLAFAVLVLGSGGRGESLLAMDQDNAIVYAPGGTADDDGWLQKFGAQVADILDQAGVAYCKGGVMAKNSAWRKDAAQWRETVNRWLSRSRPQDILNADIFFDAVPVYGDTALGEGLRREAVAAAGRATGFLKLLSLNAADFRVPLGWFGRFELDKGRIDLKVGGILPIFSCARVLALKHRIADRATAARLAAVREKLPGQRDKIDLLIEAHRILLGAILRQQLRDLEAGIALSNRVDPSHLDAADRQQLQWALQKTSVIQDLLSVPDMYA